MRSQRQDGAEVGAVHEECAVFPERRVLGNEVGGSGRLQRQYSCVGQVLSGPVHLVGDGGCLGRVVGERMRPRHGDREARIVGEVYPLLKATPYTERGKKKCVVGNHDRGSEEGSEKTRVKSERIDNQVLTH